MSKTCKECGAKCCRYFCFEIDEPDDFEEFDDIRWYLLHEGVTVHVDEGDWFIQIENRCRMLADDNSCTAYDARPLICRKYEPENCDHSDGDYDYDEQFTTPEELEAYARETLGAAAYNRAKARALAKVGRKRKKTVKQKN